MEIYLSWQTRTLEINLGPCDGPWIGVPIYIDIAPPKKQYLMAESLKGVGSSHDIIYGYVYIQTTIHPFANVWSQQLWQIDQNCVINLISRKIIRVNYFQSMGIQQFQTKWVPDLVDDLNAIIMNWGNHK